MNEQEIFQQALARGPDERAAFLDQACAGEPALRASVEAAKSVGVLNPSPGRTAARLHRWDA